MKKHYFEQNIELTTEHLLKRIAVLKSCNAALCSKLARVQMNPASLPPAPLKTDTASNDSSLKLCITTNQIQHLIESGAQDKHAA